MTLVAIVEHSASLRRRFAESIGMIPNLQVAGPVATYAEGLSLAAEQEPDVMLIGMTVADAPGPAAIQQLRRRFPHIPVVAIATLETDDELFAAMRVGAVAYTGQNFDTTELNELVRRAAAGEYVFAEQMADRPGFAVRVLDQFRSLLGSDTDARDVFSPLSNREREVLRRISAGLSNAEISSALGVNARTVKTNITSIMRKMAVNDRTQAVIEALRRGWLDGEDPPAGVPARPRGPRPSPSGHHAVPPGADEWVK